MTASEDDGGGAAQRVLRRADAFQRRHRAPAFLVAVAKKIGDDRAGQLAALIAYYGFFSLFPLLLVFATAASFVISQNPDLRQRLLDSVLEQFPVVGPRIGRTIDESVHTLTGSPVALTIGVIGALWTGTAVVAAAQNAMDDVWDVPRADRPGLLTRTVRAFVLLFVFGAAIVLSTFLAGTGAETGLAVIVLRTVSIAGAVLVSVAVFSFAYRILTVADVGWRDVVPGAIVTGVVWTALLMIGSWFVGRRIAQASAVYGFFATVIGLLTWLYLAAQVFLVGAEVNVVRARHLWPRSLVEPPLADSDRRVLAGQAQEERAEEQETVDVRFEDQEPGHRGAPR
jgi:YihY family inner membrane protein